MPSIGLRCHELRIADRHQTWRIIYYLAEEAVVILEVLSKKIQATPKEILATCRRRLSKYIDDAGEGLRSS